MGYAFMHVNNIQTHTHMYIHRAQAVCQCVYLYISMCVHDIYTFCVCLYICYVVFICVFVYMLCCGGWRSGKAQRENE